ncbi:MAG: hypothetical protein ACXWX2_06290 [Actinomycetota bacterium]
MARTSDEAARKGARAEVVATASEFALASEPIVVAALRRRIEALLEARPEWFGALSPDVAGALREAADRAIARGAANAAKRLADPELWLEPMTAPGVSPNPGAGWDGELPAWFTGLLGRFTRRQAPELGSLDDPGHRIWVALLLAARPLDPVLEEFGLAPSSTPDLGGGHYGLQPKTAAQLDPSGTLGRLWKRYRLAYGRLAALSRGR